MDFSDDHFALFELPRAFRVDAGALEARYREILSQIHPDKFVNSGGADRRLSLQWATRINEAYQTLKRPLSRARYLLHLAGQDLGAEENTAMPAEFLVEQMAWRESVFEARATANQQELEELHRRLKHDIDECYAEIAVLLDDRHDLTRSADRVRRLMFLDKLLFEIDDAMAALDA